MAETKQPKVETKRPRKRNTAVAKGTKTSKVKVSDVETPVTDEPAAATPSPKETQPDSPATAVPVTEKSATAEPVVDTPVASEASEEEIRKAKELLRAHGYGLICYRDAGEKVKRTIGAGLDFVKGQFKRFGGWLSAKRDEIKAKYKELKRVAAASTAIPPTEGVARQPVTEPIVHPVAQKAQDAEVVTPADSDVPKCGVCGAELVPGARFCRKCGEPVTASV